MIVGVLVIVFLVLPEGNGPVASTRQKAEQKLGAAAEQARRALSDVEVEAIGKELRETGRVVRRRSSPPSARSPRRPRTCARRRRSRPST